MRLWTVHPMYLDVRAWCPSGARRHLQSVIRWSTPCLVWSPVECRRGSAVRPNPAVQGIAGQGRHAACRLRECQHLGWHHVFLGWRPYVPARS